jgi:hypothetical protein
MVFEQCFIQQIVILNTGFDLSSPLHYGADPNSPRVTTPHRQRTDLRLESSIVRQINIGSPSSAGGVDSARNTPARRPTRASSSTPGSQRPGSVAPSDADEPHLVIWGTNVVVNRTRRKFRQFLLNFREASDEIEMDERPNEDAVDPNEPLYIRKIYDVRSCAFNRLFSNCFRHFWCMIIYFPPLIIINSSQTYPFSH